MKKQTKKYISGQKSNRRAAIRNRILAVIILTVIMILLFCGFSKNGSTAAQAAEDYAYKTIVVEEGESLWSIAKEYHEESPDSIKSYIKNLKEMNDLHNDTIKVGQKLIVYYYE